MFTLGKFESVYNDKYASKYNPGDFSFMFDEMWRDAISHDYSVISPEGWTALKRHNINKSFMWDTNGELWDEIKSKMYGGHSGASQACSLRCMERIAKIGWDEYVKESIILQERERARKHCGLKDYSK